MGISELVSLALMGVLVASFAATTLDSACRLQRYVIQEIWASIGLSTGGKQRMRSIAWSASGRYVATGIAVVLGACWPHSRQWWGMDLDKYRNRGLILWPLFGVTNQLLAGLAFLVIAFYLWRRNRPIWFLVLPMVLMLVIPMWAMIEQIFTNRGGDAAWWDQDRWLLVGIGLATIALEVWMIVEGLLLFPRVRGLIEDRKAANQKSTDFWRSSPAYPNCVQAVLGMSAGVKMPP